MANGSFEVRRSNLKKLVIERFEGNRAAFSRAAGVHHNQINLLLSDSEQHRRNMGEGLARRLEQGLGLPVGWMDIPHGGTGQEVVYTMTSSMPPELQAVLRGDSDIQSITALPNWFEKAGGKITAPQNIVFGSLITHDIEPEVPHGTRVFVDQGVHAFLGDGVYIIAKGENVFVRRVRYGLDGSWTISSAAETIRPTTLKGLKILAKIVLMSRDSQL